jgi:hypothetical protein
MTTIVGGVYAERCIEPTWREVYGSAGRAAAAMSAANPGIHLVTYRSDLLGDGLANLISVYDMLVEGPAVGFAIEFDYTHSLAVPRITPRPDAISQQDPIDVHDDVVLRFGMLEGTARIKAHRAVYDPQSAFDPRPFAENGSQADELALILNRREAACLTNEIEPERAAAALLTRGDAQVVVVKMGGRGALVASTSGSSVVPAYQSASVFKLGSGDVFSAAFTQFWAIENRVVAEAADLASRATSRYCETMSLPISGAAELAELEPAPVRAQPGRVYIAAPFFNLAELWLVEEVRDQLLAMGVEVFSPFHDVGPGSAELVAPLDLAALDDCDAVLAVLNGGDAGTIFEIGYATAKGIPIVALAQNMRPEDMKMPAGSGCLIVTDVVSAIYQTVWQLR